MLVSTMYVCRASSHVGCSAKTSLDNASAQLLGGEAIGFGVPLARQSGRRKSDRRGSLGNHDAARRAHSGFPGNTIHQIVKSSV